MGLASIHSRRMVWGFQIPAQISQPLRNVPAHGFVLSGIQPNHLMQARNTAIEVITNVFQIDKGGRVIACRLMLHR
jgi:hypothetical protein